MSKVHCSHHTLAPQQPALVSRTPRHTCSRFSHRASHPAHDVGLRPHALQRQQHPGQRRQRCCSLSSHADSALPPCSSFSRATGACAALTVGVRLRCPWHPGAAPQVYNNGNTIQVQWAPGVLRSDVRAWAGSNITDIVAGPVLNARRLRRVALTPLQFHFHSTSEHLVDGACCAVLRPNDHAHAARSAQHITLAASHPAMRRAAPPVAAPVARRHVRATGDAHCAQRPEVGAAGLPRLGLPLRHGHPRPDLHQPQ